MDRIQFLVTVLNPYGQHHRDTTEYSIGTFLKLYSHIFARRKVILWARRDSYPACSRVLLSW